jgi:hypothetical protein
VLAELFKVSEETVRGTFHKVIEILFVELKDEIRWPTDEEFEEVKQKCAHLCAGPFLSVVAIIDGTEVRCQRS